MGSRVLLDDGYDIDPAERVFTINRRNRERWKRDLLNNNTSRVMSRSLTGDVGSPIQFVLKHLKLAVVNTGRLLCRLRVSISYTALLSGRDPRKWKRE